MPIHTTPSLKNVPLKEQVRTIAAWSTAYWKWRRKRPRHGLDALSTALCAAHVILNQLKQLVDTWRAVGGTWAVRWLRFASPPSCRDVLPELTLSGIGSRFLPSFPSISTSIISADPHNTPVRWVGKIWRPHLAEVKWLCWGHGF